MAIPDRLDEPDRLYRKYDSELHVRPSCPRRLPGLRTKSISGSSNRAGAKRPETDIMHGDFKNHDGVQSEFEMKNAIPRRPTFLHLHYGAACKRNHEITVEWTLLPTADPRWDSARHSERSSGVYQNGENQQLVGTCETNYASALIAICLSFSQRQR